MAIEEQVLSEISRSVSRVSESSESFRVAASQQNNNIQRVVKDISSMFRAQSSNQEELNSAIGELKDEMSETNDKTDAVATRLNETVNVQNSMLSELRGIGKSMDNLSNIMQMFFMQGGSGSGGAGGGGGGPGGLSGGRFSETIIKFLLGGAAGAGVFGAAAVGNQLRANVERGGAATPAGTAIPQNSPLGSATGAASAQAGGGNADQISTMLAAIKQKESGGESDPYTSIARGSDNKPLPLGPNTGTGAYQFTPATWQESAAAANVDVSQYQQARDAPAEIQDRVARARAEYLLKQANGDISKIPAYWNGGLTGGENPSPSVRDYQQSVMEDYNRRQQAAQQNNAAPNSSPGTSNDYVQFLLSRSQGGVNAEKLNPTFAAKLMRAIQAAEEKTGDSVTITSGYRTPEQQAQLYANHIRKAYIYNGKTYMPNASQLEPVAEPGKSAHQSGNAVDLSQGRAREWIRENAGRFGLIDLAGDPPHFSDVPENMGAPSTGGTPPTNVTPEASTPSSGIAGAPAGASPLMAGLGMPAGLGPESEPSGIGMGDMSSYNPLAILGSTLGGNMFMPSGQSGAIGAALNVLSGSVASITQPEPAPVQQSQNQQAQPQSSNDNRIDPNMYNHPEDRMVSPSWMDRILGIYPNEASGVNTTYGGRG